MRAHFGARELDLGSADVKLAVLGIYPGTSGSIPQLALLLDFGPS